MARRSRLTKHVHQLLVYAASCGMPHWARYQYAQLNKTTYYRWLHQGERGEGENATKLVQDMQAAEAEYYAKLAQTIKDAAIGFKETKTEEYIEGTLGEDGETFEPTPGAKCRKKRVTTTKIWPEHALKVLARLDPENWSDKIDLTTKGNELDGGNSQEIIVIERQNGETEP